jgi:hypothetical protein
MARHRRTLEDLLADAAGQNRANAGLAYSTPAMTPIDGEMILPGAISQDNFSDELQADLAQRIDDAAASVVTAARLQDGAVTANTIADFAITVKKFHSDRHHLY